MSGNPLMLPFLRASYPRGDQGPVDPMAAKKLKARRLSQDFDPPPSDPKPEPEAHQAHYDADGHFVPASPKFRKRGVTQLIEKVVDRPTDSSAVEWSTPSFGLQKDPPAWGGSLSARKPDKLRSRDQAAYTRGRNGKLQSTRNPMKNNYVKVKRLRADEFEAEGMQQLPSQLIGVPAFVRQNSTSRKSGPASFRPRKRTASLSGSFNLKDIDTMTSAQIMERIAKENSRSGVADYYALLQAQVLNIVESVNELHPDDEQDLRNKMRIALGMDPESGSDDDVDAEELEKYRKQRDREIERKKNAENERIRKVLSDLNDPHKKMVVDEVSTFFEGKRRDESNELKRLQMVEFEQAQAVDETESAASKLDEFLQHKDLKTVRLLNQYFASLQTLSSRLFHPDQIGSLHDNNIRMSKHVAALLETDEEQRNAEYQEHQKKQEIKKKRKAAKRHTKHKMHSTKSDGDSHSADEALIMKLQLKVSMLEGKLSEQEELVTILSNQDDANDAKKARRTGVEVGEVSKKTESKIVGLTQMITKLSEDVQTEKNKCRIVQQDNERLSKRVEELMSFSDSAALSAALQDERKQEEELKRKRVEEAMEGLHEELRVAGAEIEAEKAHAKHLDGKVAKLNDDIAALRKLRETDKIKMKKLEKWKQKAQERFGRDELQVLSRSRRSSFAAATDKSKEHMMAKAATAGEVEVIELELPEPTKSAPSSRPTSPTPAATAATDANREKIDRYKKKIKDLQAVQKKQQRETSLLQNELKEKNERYAELQQEKENLYFTLLKTQDISGGSKKKNAKSGEKRPAWLAVKEKGLLSALSSEPNAMEEPIPAPDAAAQEGKSAMTISVETAGAALSPLSPSRKSPKKKKKKSSKKEKDSDKQKKQNLDPERMFKYLLELEGKLDVSQDMVSELDRQLKVKDVADKKEVELIQLRYEEQNKELEELRSSWQEMVLINSKHDDDVKAHNLLVDETMAKDSKVAMLLEENQRNANVIASLRRRLKSAGVEEKPSTTENSGNNSMLGWVDELPNARLERLIGNCDKQAEDAAKVIAEAEAEKAKLRQQLDEYNATNNDEEDAALTSELLAKHIAQEEAHRAEMAAQEAAEAAARQAEQDAIEAAAAAALANELAQIDNPLNREIVKLKSELNGEARKAKYAQTQFEKRAEELKKTVRVNRLWETGYTSFVERLDAAIKDPNVRAITPPSADALEDDMSDMSDGNTADRTMQARYDVLRARVIHLIALHNGETGTLKKELATAQQLLEEAHVKEALMDKAILEMKKESTSAKMKARRLSAKPKGDKPKGDEPKPPTLKKKSSTLTKTATIKAPSGKTEKKFKKPSYVKKISNAKNFVRVASKPKKGKLKPKTKRVASKQEAQATTDAALDMLNDAPTSEPTEQPSEVSPSGLNFRSVDESAATRASSNFTPFAGPVETPVDEDAAEDANVSMDVSPAVVTESTDTAASDSKQYFRGEVISPQPVEEESDEDRDPADFLAQYERVQSERPSDDAEVNETETVVEVASDAAEQSSKKVETVVKPTPATSNAQAPVVAVTEPTAEQTEDLPVISMEIPDQASGAPSAAIMDAQVNPAAQPQEAKAATVASKVDTNEAKAHVVSRESSDGQKVAAPSSAADTPADIAREETSLATQEAPAQDAAQPVVSESVSSNTVAMISSRPSSKPSQSLTSSRPSSKNELGRRVGEEPAFVVPAAKLPAASPSSDMKAAEAHVNALADAEVAVMVPPESVTATTTIEPEEPGPEPDPDPVPEEPKPIIEPEAVQAMMAVAKTATAAEMEAHFDEVLDTTEKTTQKYTAEAQRIENIAALQQSLKDEDLVRKESDNSGDQYVRDGEADILIIQREPSQEPDQLSSWNQNSDEQEDTTASVEVPLVQDVSLVDYDATTPLVQRAVDAPQVRPKRAPMVDTVQGFELEKQFFQARAEERQKKTMKKAHPEPVVYTKSGVADDDVKYMDPVLSIQPSTAPFNGRVVDVAKPMHPYTPDPIIAHTAPIMTTSARPAPTSPSKDPKLLSETAQAVNRAKSGLGVDTFVPSADMVSEDHKDIMAYAEITVQLLDQNQPSGVTVMRKGSTGAAKTPYIVNSRGSVSKKPPVNIEQRVPAFPADEVPDHFSFLSTTKPASVVPDSGEMFEFPTNDRRNTVDEVKMTVQAELRAAQNKGPWISDDNKVLEENTRLDSFLAQQETVLVDETLANAGKLAVEVMTKEQREALAMEAEAKRKEKYGKDMRVEVIMSKEGNDETNVN